MAKRMNGSVEDSDERLAAGFRRSDCVRLMTQCLQGLGYNGAASRLEEDSGILLLAQPVSRFRQGVLEGQWGLMDGLVDEMQLQPNCRARVCFLIYRQKYLELLEAGCSAEALCCLREQLAPLQAHITAHEPSESSAGAVEHNALRELSCYLMCGHIEELKRRAAWDGAQGSSRQMLLQELQRHIPPSLLLPDNRLLTLLQQAVLWQTSQCFDQQSFCTSSSSSLFEDFSCSRNVIPRETHHILEKHSDEVWYVQFSHNGELLASASKDNMVIVWDVRRAEMTHLVVRPCSAGSTCVRKPSAPYPRTGPAHAILDAAPRCSASSHATTPTPPPPIDGSSAFSPLLPAGARGPYRLTFVRGMESRRLAVAHLRQRQVAQALAGDCPEPPPCQASVQSQAPT